MWNSEREAVTQPELKFHPFPTHSHSLCELVVNCSVDILSCCRGQPHIGAFWLQIGILTSPGSPAVAHHEQDGNMLQASTGENVLCEMMKLQIRLENVSESFQPNRGTQKRGLLSFPASLNIQTFPWNFCFEAAQQQRWKVHVSKAVQSRLTRGKKKKKRP